MSILVEWVIWTGAIVLSGAYAVLIHRYLRGWAALPSIVPEADFVPTTRISVLIPARNEAENIAACLESLAQQTYPRELVEVLVIDDHSTDETGAIARAFTGIPVRLLSLAALLEPDERRVAYKKEALRQGVAASSGDLIVCTDADCVLPSGWLMQMAWANQTMGWQCITGPVLTMEEEGLLNRFQGLDFAGMMVLTAAGIAAGITPLANGAAFAYTRMAHNAVRGYEGLTHLASGDDLLLLHKIQARFPGKVGFLKTPEAVLTRAQPDWGSFFRQRLRWGTKSGQYQQKQITAVLGLVFFVCWGILLSAAVLWIYPVQAGGILILLATTKGVSDYLLLRRATQYFRQPGWIHSFLPAQVLHVLYIALTGLAANSVRTYTWKGRRVS